VARIAEVLAAAVRHHQAGQREEAEKLYREILRIDPEHPDALHLLGAIGNETGDQEMAVEYIRRAIALRPDIAEFHNSLGNALQAQGRLDEAVAAYRQALQLKPEYATAHSNLGTALKAQGRLDEAIASYRRALELQPQYAAALCNLGGALQAKGQLDEAVTACRQALAISPTFTEAYNNLGNALHTQGKDDEAETAYRQALKLDPNYAEAYSNLGAALQADGRLDEAVRSMRQAIRLRPAYAEAHANLGSALVNLGEFEEAIEHLREAIERNPGLASAYHELANLAGQGSYQVSESEIEIMHELLSTGRLSMDDAGRLHFALGRLLDRDGRYDEAFRHYRQGNQLRVQYLRERNIQIDHERYLSLIDDMISLFDGAYFQRVRSFGIDSDLPVFIVGMPRSGTTLAEQVLASHPEIHGAGELKQIGRLVAGLPGRLNSTKVYPSCMEQMTADSARALAEQHLQFLRGLGGDAVRIVDKMPLNYNHLGMIATLFPGARVVHCRRSPMDTCMSCFMQYAVPASLEELGVCYTQYEKLMAHWRSVLPIPIYELSYERMVDDQETVTRELIAFCGLEWDDACLKFYETDRPVQTPTRVDVRRPIYQSAVGRWRRYEAHLKPLIEMLGEWADVSGKEGDH